jgi:hypothetical protein
VVTFLTVICWETAALIYLACAWLALRHGSLYGFNGAWADIGICLLDLIIAALTIPNMRKEPLLVGREKPHGSTDPTEAKS